MKKLLAEIWDAILGSEHDYTSIRMGKAILLLAVPMVAEMMMESLFAILDILFVSRNGDAAISVVGLTEAMMTLVYAVGVGLSMAVTGLVARRIGEKHDRDAGIAAIQSVLLSIILSFLFSVPGILFAENILTLMHATPEVVAMGSGYTRIMLGGNMFIMLLFTNNAIFRSAGAPALSLRVLVVANLLNIILDPCLIFGLGPFPKFGVTGAAIATNIGRGIGVCYQFYLLFKGASRIRFSLKIFELAPKVMIRLLVLSGGGISQYLIATSSWIFLYRILAAFKTEVVAGYTIAIRIIIFFMLPAWGLANAASTLVGQNLGAKNPDRAQRSVWLTTYVTGIYMLLLTGLFLVIPGFFARPFSYDGQSYHIAVTSLRIVGLGMLFYGCEMIFLQAFNGAGDTYTPTMLNFIGFWIIEIPLAWLLSMKTDLKQNGVFYAVFISETLIAIMAILFFMRGKWKTRIV